MMKMSRYNKYIEEDEKRGGMTLDGIYPLISRCWYCKHYECSWCCKAFPEGIPPELWKVSIGHEPEYCNVTQKITFERGIK